MLSSSSTDVVLVVRGARQLFSTGSSGVAAYRKGDQPDPVVGNEVWQISDEAGRFTPAPGVTSVGAGGYTVPPKKRESAQYSAAGVLGGGVSRRQAEKLLASRRGPTNYGETCGITRTRRPSRRGGGTPTWPHTHAHPQLRACSGCFVIRESTSAPNTFVLSVLTAPGIQHLRIETTEDQRLQVSGTQATHATLQALLDHHSTHTLVMSDGAEMLLKEQVRHA